MKIRIALFTLSLLLVGCATWPASAQQRAPVMANSNGSLAAPTNFFGANEEKISAALGTLGAGEANLIGDAGSTNTTTTFGISFGKSGLTLQVKTLSRGGGIFITNQGTNLVLSAEV